MEILDQTKNKYLKNSCILAGLLHIIQFNFGITVYPNTLMSLAIMAEKTLLWFPNLGGYFEPLYKWFIQEINKKLNLNFEMRKQFILSFDGDTLSYGIGIKNYSPIYKEAEKNGVLTMLDIEKMKEYTGKTYYHHMLYDYSKQGHIINSMGMLPYQCTLEVLKELEKLDYAYSPMRTIEANNEFTRNVTRITLDMQRAELKGKIYIHLKEDTKYEDKANELFYYGRDIIN